MIMLIKVMLIYYQKVQKQNKEGWDSDVTTGADSPQSPVASEPLLPALQLPSTPPRHDHAVTIQKPETAQLATVSLPSASEDPSTSKYEWLYYQCTYDDCYLSAYN